MPTARAFDRANGRLFTPKNARPDGLQGNGDGPQAAQLPIPPALADEQIAARPYRSSGSISSPPAIWKGLCPPLPA